MRVLISIGCNEYSHQKRLYGAEADASRIFDALVRPQVGDYDPAGSKLLLSPSIAEVREALREVLFSHGSIDTFTFFFAGHGGVRSGSFYMLVEDSASDSFSFSALSLSDLLLAVGEAAPLQSNIIIDACEAGGLISDLGVLLKSEILGDAGTPGITLVATAAQNEYSEETDDGGVGTAAILDCIEGRDFIQDSSAALDLVEIGRRVSTRLRYSSEQSPVVWGLNLYGPPQFCRNPQYGSDPTRSLRDVLQAWPTGVNAAIREHYDSLWQAYTSVSGEWNPRSFAVAVDEVVNGLSSQPEALAALFERLGPTVLERARLSTDAFRPAEVGAALVVCLLPHFGNPAVERQAALLIAEIGTSLLGGGRELLDHLQTDRYALLNRDGGGLSDLFYLPLRISSVLAWLGAATLMGSEVTFRNETESVFSEVLRRLLDMYWGSIVVMSDAQASCWAIVISTANRLGLIQEAEALVGKLYSSLLAAGGALARGDIPPDKVLAYLMARQRNDFTEVLDLLERPDETTTVLFRAASLLNLLEEFDGGLWQLDGHDLMAYINLDFGQFGAETMRDGSNLIWGIGYDVFRVSDFVRSWPTNIPTPSTDPTRSAVVLASLLYPDRVAWFELEAGLPAAASSNAAD